MATTRIEAGLEKPQSPVEVIESDHHERESEGNYASDPQRGDSLVLRSLSS
jgi:hypothetical protein